MENNNNDLLYTIFQNVNAWLHFVEAKNAALIAFNIAVLSALMGSNEYSGSKWTTVRSLSTAIKCLIGSSHCLRIRNKIKPAMHRKAALGLTLP